MTAQHAEEIIEVTDHRVLAGPAGEAALASAKPPAGIRYRLVHAQTPDYLFLHEPRLDVHDGTIFVNFSNAPVRESEPAQIMRGRRSNDGGDTWSDPEIVAGGFADGRRRHETAPLLSRPDGLWAFVGRYDYGSKYSLGMEVYRLDPVTGRFAPASDGLVAPGFIPFVRPQRLANGNWIIAGHADQVSRAAVAISNGDDLLSWRVVTIGRVPHFGYPESTLIIDGATVACIVRPEVQQPTAGLAISYDHGETFGPIERTDLPSIDTKLHSGTLSSGHHYVLFNAARRPDLPGEHRRHRLLIGILPPGPVRPMERVFTVIEDTPPAIAAEVADLGESSGPHAWAYPEAVESDGELHIVFSMEKRHCWMASIPVQGLIG